MLSKSNRNQSFLVRRHGNCPRTAHGFPIQRSREACARERSGITRVSRANDTTNAPRIQGNPICARDLKASERAAGRSPRNSAVRKNVVRFRRRTPQNENSASCFFEIIFAYHLSTCCDCQWSSTSPSLLSATINVHCRST